MGAQRDVLPMRGTFPTPPEQLDDIGRAAWEVGYDLWSDGTLQKRDLINWTLFCEAVQEKAHCETLTVRDGEYQSAQNGILVQHPAIKRRMQAEAVIRKYSTAFGLIPDARKKRPAVAQGVAQRKK